MGAKRYSQDWQILLWGDGLTPKRCSLPMGILRTVSRKREARQPRSWSEDPVQAWKLGILCTATLYPETGSPRFRLRGRGEGPPLRVLSLRSMKISTVIISLRSKRFRVSSSRKVGTRAKKKKGMTGEGEGKEGTSPSPFFFFVPALTFAP